jgi:DNA-binding MarR family transcriptional regulator
MSINGGLVDESTSDRGHRRSPTPEQLRSWRTFVETAERMRSTVGSRLQADSGVSTGDYSILLALSEAPDKRMRSSALAKHIDWERSRLSHHLARMEQRGLIEREDCATDSRGAEIVLTPEGANQFRRASAPHLRSVQQYFVDAFTPEQLRALDEAMNALGGHLDASTATL